MNKLRSCTQFLFPFISFLSFVLAFSTTILGQDWVWYPSLFFFFLPIPPYLRVSLLFLFTNWVLLLLDCPQKLPALHQCLGLLTSHIFHLLYLFSLTKTKLPNALLLRLTLSTSKSMSDIQFTHLLGVLIGYQQIFDISQDLCSILIGNSL